MAECWCGGGTLGYSRHVQRVNKTQPCPESRQANTEYHRDYQARRREAEVVIDLTDDEL